MSILAILGLAIGGALFLEGMAYALMPGVMARMAEQLREAGPAVVQATGVMCAVAGAVIVSLVLAAL